MRSKPIQNNISYFHNETVPNGCMNSALNTTRHNWLYLFEKLWGWYILYTICITIWYVPYIMFLHVHINAIILKVAWILSFFSLKLSLLAFVHTMNLSATFLMVRWYPPPPFVSGKADRLHSRSPKSIRSGAQFLIFSTLQEN